MVPTLTISGKVIGKTQPVFTNWELSLPETFRDDRGAFTLRDLLTQIVLAEVALFSSRQTQGRLMNVLSPAQINLGVEQGKIDSGDRDLHQTVDSESAIEVALQAFTDGLYFVFLDDQQQEHLDTVISLQSHSQLLFLRLVPLVGG